MLCTYSDCKEDNLAMKENKYSENKLDDFCNGRSHYFGAKEIPGAYMNIGLGNGNSE